MTFFCRTKWLQKLAIVTQNIALGGLNMRDVIEEKGDTGQLHQLSNLMQTPDSLCIYDLYIAALLTWIFSK